VGGKASRLRAGVSVFKSFTTQNGSITPLVNVSYLNMLDGESQLMANGVDFDTDTSGSGYSLELGVTGTYHKWDIGVRMGASETSATDLNLSTNVNVRYHW
jgi:outer membrane autotransporter protein